MKRTKEWWARLSKQERSELVYLERAKSHRSSNECPNCGTPYFGYGLCLICHTRLFNLIQKASGRLITLD
jgi:hypothetical protein